MGIVVYFNDIEKASVEALAYASELGKNLGLDVIGVSSGISEEDARSAGKYGVSKVIVLGEEASSVRSAQLSKIVSEISEELGATIVLSSHSIFNESLIARLGVKLKADIVTNVIGMVDTSDGFVVRRSIYTNKAFSKYSLNRERKVLTIKKNSFSFEVGESLATTEARTVTVESDKVIVKEVKKAGGAVLLPEADLVVSAGRGLKGSENWGMIEELAELMGAGTACSKPVSDVGWRPHHEHVGQTGIKISPNLYIAIGISGAIQHLAGVSSSKVIVVINTDEEAPFFKAADYGIVGDAFQVVPKLIEALKS